MIPTTYISLHAVREFSASTREPGYPIILHIDGHDGPMQITLHLEEFDGERSRAVVDALNAAMAIDLPPIPDDGSEAAAYAAAHLAYAYQGLTR
jgi:hypothetical protein